MSVTEEWDICPNWDKNYRCFFSNAGRWRLEKNVVFGKWVFNIEKIKGKPSAPTFADQRNFFTGLLECEWKNDNFVFSDGRARNPQKEIKLNMFKNILDEIGQRFDFKDTPRGIDFYLKQNNKKDDTPI